MAGTAELVLRTWGFTGERLLRLAARAARDNRRIPDGYLDDAVSHLAEVGLRAAMEFDPAKATSLTHGTIDKRFEAFAYYRMRLRLIDWLRSTSNGNEFGRNGTLGREKLIDEPQPELDEPYAGVDELRVNQIMRERFRRAASMSGLTEGEWALRSMVFLSDLQLDEVDTSTSSSSSSRSSRVGAGAQTFSRISD